MFTNVDRYDTVKRENNSEGRRASWRGQCWTKRQGLAVDRHRDAAVKEISKKGWVQTEVWWCEHEAALL